MDTASAVAEQHGRRPLVLGAAVAAAGLGLLGVAVAMTRGKPSSLPPSPGQPGSPSPGCLPLELRAVGPGMVSGCGGSTRSCTQLCVEPGEPCVYTAYPDPDAVFLRWEGPDGATSRARQVTIPDWGAGGFIVGFFGPAGPGGQPAPQPSPPPARRPCPTSWGSIVTSDQPGDNRQFVLDACGRKHWIDSGFQFALCFYDPFGVTACDTSVFPEGPSVSALGCCPGTGDGQCRGC